MIFCPASGYEIQAPEFKQWKATRKHPRYNEMIFAELSPGGAVQKIRLDPDTDAPPVPDVEVSPDAPPVLPPEVPAAPEADADPAPDAPPEDTAGDAHEDFATGPEPAAPPRAGKPASGRRRSN